MIIGELPPNADQDDVAVARSFLSGSQLLGRRAQCERLQQYVQRTLSGRGSALLVCGESGTGRSRILAEAALIGQMRGLTVVRAVARSRGSVGGLAVDLVQGLLQAAPVEAQRASAGRPRIAAQSFAADSGEARVQVLSELTEFVSEVARARPLFITIDDLDRADEFSGALAAAIAYPSGDCSLMVVAGYDVRQDTPVLANVHGLVETLRLGPLDRTQTELLCASLFGEVLNLERLSDWLYRVAGDNRKLTLQPARSRARIGQPQRHLARRLGSKSAHASRQLTAAAPKARSADFAARDHRHHAPERDCGHDLPEARTRPAAARTTRAAHARPIFQQR